MDDATHIDGSGCATCWPADADAAWAAGRRLARDLTLVDESHFIVAIARCRDCHQRYLTVFSETIDWADGEDPQFRQRLPVGNDDIIRLAAAGAAVESVFAEVGTGRRVLFRDFPKAGDPVCGWRTGLRAAPHD